MMAGREPGGQRGRWRAAGAATLAAVLGAVGLVALASTNPERVELEQVRAFPTARTALAAARCLG
jgi:hypothetical protein